MNNRVVVTGIGVQSCLGDDVVDQRKAILEGKSAFTSIRNAILPSNNFMAIGSCKNPNSTKLYDRKVQKVTTKRDLLGLAAAFDSLRNARIEKGSVDPERIGIFTGAASTHVNDLKPYSELLKSVAENGKVDVSKFGKELLGNVNPMVMMQTLMNNVLCYVSIPLDIRGVNANFIDFQVSGLRAIGEGYWAIKEGRADQIVAGGISGAPDLYHAGEGIDIGYMAPPYSDENASTDIVRPFDKGRSGTVLSEAAAFVVLESLESARKRNCKIFGEITGFSLNSEGNFHFLGPVTSDKMVDCFKQIIDSAGLNSKNIGAIYSHANGAIKGDGIDLRVLDNVFKNFNQPVAVTSIKGVTGETNEASGVLSLIDALFSIEETILPAIHNFTETENPPANVRLLKSNESFDGGQILVTCQSFSGINAIISVKSFDD